MNGFAPELSIILPAYNEEKRIGATLDRISGYFAARSPTLAGLEVIVVDDGSSDGTPRLVQDAARTMPWLRLISNPENRGKGYSVRQGMLQARGRIALFTDADLSAPIEESERLFAAIESGNDVAIGSRALDRSLISVHQSRFREIAGIIFNRFVRMIAQLPIEDTQQQRIAGFGFDPEILFLAKRHGLRIAEVPVRWSHDPATKVHVYRDSVLMLLDLFRVRWNSVVGRYPLQRS
jgi:glycosyltransferase involved in cell wall biosynthesis